jgi:hypothetical protein
MRSPTTSRKAQFAALLVDLVSFAQQKSSFISRSRNLRSISALGIPRPRGPVSIEE